MLPTQLAAPFDSADNDTTVRGDPDALERVLRNLIDNALAAIQATGRIDVHLRRLNGYVQAGVADDGPGVPEHQRQRIFERFVDIDAVVAGLRARGAELVGELERYEDSYRLCYVRGPEGIIVELAEQIG